MNTITRRERHDAGLRIVAEWDSVHDTTDVAGPQRLAIELTGEKERAGITLAVLRRAERHISDMTAEVNEIPAVGGRHAMVRHYLEERLAALATDGKAFHQGLLDLLADLVERHHAEPEKALADAMRMPEETLRACLHVARERVATSDPLPDSEGRNS
jgi:hypothetical protein